MHQRSIDVTKSPTHSEFDIHRITLYLEHLLDPPEEYYITTL